MYNCIDKCNIVCDYIVIEAINIKNFNKTVAGSWPVELNARAESWRVSHFHMFIVSYLITGIQMTASEYIKAQGLPSLAFVARAVRKPDMTLYRWYTNNFALFEAVVMGLYHMKLANEVQSRVKVKHDE